MILALYLHVLLEVVVKEGLKSLLSLGEGVLVKGGAGLQDEEGGLHHIQLCLQQVKAWSHCASCLGGGQGEVDIVLQHRECHNVPKGEVITGAMCNNS